MLLGGEINGLVVTATTAITIGIWIRDIFVVFVK